MNQTTRDIRDIVLCMLFLFAILGIYSAAAIYLTDPVQPTPPEGAYTDWSKE